MTSQMGGRGGDGRNQLRKEIFTFCQFILSIAVASMVPDIIGGGRGGGAKDSLLAF